MPIVPNTKKKSSSPSGISSPEQKTKYNKTNEYERKGWNIYQLNFAPLGGNRCDCAVLACAMMSLCDTRLPGDVLDVGLAATCTPPKINDTTDVAKLGPPPEIPVCIRMMTADPETESAAREWLSRSPEVRVRIELGDSVTELPSGFKSMWYGLHAGEKVNIISVEICGGLQRIGDHFLSGYSNLTSVDLPDCLQEVGEEFLQGCSSLTSVDLPDSLQTVGRAFLGGCSSLTSVDLPDSLQQVDDYLLCGCSSLISVNLPNSLQTVGDGFMCNCTSLTSLVLPDSLQAVGGAFLDGCTSLTSVNLPDGLQKVDGYGFMGECTSLTSVKLPNGVQQVGSSFMYGCTSLTSIVLPDSLQDVDVIFLHGCTSLTSVQCPSHLSQHLPSGVNQEQP